MRSLCFSGKRSPKIASIYPKRDQLSLLIIPEIKQVNPKNSVHLLCYCLSLATTRIYEGGGSVLGLLKWELTIRQSQSMKSKGMYINLYEVE